MGVAGGTPALRLQSAQADLVPFTAAISIAGVCATTTARSFDFAMIRSFDFAMIRSFDSATVRQWQAQDERNYRPQNEWVSAPGERIWLYEPQ